MSSFWLAADGTTTNAYVYKLLGTGGAGINEIYIHADVYVCPDQLVSTGDYFDAIDLYGDGGNTFPTTGNYPNKGDPEGPFVDASPQWISETVDVIGAAATSGLTTIDCHIKVSTSTLVYIINGTTYDKSLAGIYSGYISQLDVLVFGNSFAFGPNKIQYCTNVTAGTSGFGSTDIVSDDFSGGTFAAWDGTHGTVSIVGPLTDPCTLGVADAVFDGQQAFRVA